MSVSHQLRTRWDCDECGDSAAAHEHYHGGDYCGRCPCTAYRRTPWHIVLDWLSR